MRRLGLVLCGLMVATSCQFGSTPTGTEGELLRFALDGSQLAYAATYRFSMTGRLAPGVATALEIVQDPPVSIRKLETTTENADGTQVTVRSWHATNVDGDFVCADYEELGVRCLPNPIVAGTFGSAQVDEFFDLPLIPESFAAVRQTNRSARVAGEVGTCFEAVPSDPQASPDTTPGVAAEERFRYELCYAEDGVLLRGGRTVVGDEEGDRAAVVEAVSISRIVEPRDLRLPGPVTDPQDLR